MNSSLFKKPTAWLPIAMSLAALAMVVGHIALYGIVHEADEGAPAHIFQILMGGQVPLIALFALRWLPKFPAQAVRVLAVQIAASLPAFAVVYWMEHRP